jgi:hypothetical protein
MRPNFSLDFLPVSHFAGNDEVISDQNEFHLSKKPDRLDPGNTYLVGLMINLYPVSGQSGPAWIASSQ